MIDLVEVSAGGGSLALGCIQVGSCVWDGGVPALDPVLPATRRVGQSRQLLTPTCFLGRLNPDYFLGARFP